MRSLFPCGSPASSSGQINFSSCLFCPGHSTLQSLFFVFFPFFRSASRRIPHSAWIPVNRLPLVTLRDLLFFSSFFKAPPFLLQRRSQLAFSPYSREQRFFLLRFSLSFMYLSVTRPYPESFFHSPDNLHFCCGPCIVSFRVFCYGLRFRVCLVRFVSPFRKRFLFANKWQRLQFVLESLSQGLTDSLPLFPIFYNGDPSLPFVLSFL